MQRDTDSGGMGYLAIADALKDQIRRGELAPGALLPTERTLQDRFKVSRGTVRRALSYLVTSGWAESSPNRGVTAKAAPMELRSQFIGFVDHAHTLHRSLFFSLSAKFQEHGFHLVHVDSATQGTEEAVVRCADQGFAAAIVWTKVAFPNIERLTHLHHNMPILAIDHGIHGLPTDLIAADNHRGAYEAIQHFLKLGHTRIGITGMYDTLDVSQDRFSGYMRALIEAEIAPDVRNFLFTRTSLSEDDVVELLRYRLAAPDRPTALFCIQDSSIAPVIEAIHQAGLRIPEDVALIGFGNDFPIAIDCVGLTTVAIEWDSAAEKCFELTLARLENPDAPLERLNLPVSLAVRGSCGSPAETWTTKPFFVSSFGDATKPRKFSTAPRHFRTDDSAVAPHVVVHAY